MLEVKNFSYPQSAPRLKLQYETIPYASRIEDYLIHSLLTQDLPLALAHVFECLEQHTRVARVLDVQIKGLNDIVEEGLQLGIPQMTCRLLQRLIAFLKELADAVSR